MEAGAGGQGQSAAAKGVAYETALSKGLHHEGKFAEHHHNEEGMSAQQAHDHNMSKLPDSEKSNVEKSISPSVAAIRDHLAKHHSIPKNDPIAVHWTSKPGQVAKTTGKETDKENPSDLVVHHAKSGKHVGLSLKFGSKPGLRSPGIEDLHKLAHTQFDKDKLESNKKELIKMGAAHITGKSASERNASFRAAEKNPKASIDIANINKRSLEHRSEIAGNLANHFNKLSHDEKHHAIKKLMNADKTDTPVVKVHHDPKKSATHISDPVAEFNDLHNKTKEYHFEHKGMYINVHAHDKSGNIHHIAKIGIKHNSSPMTHIVGNVTHGPGYKKIIK